MVDHWHQQGHGGLEDSGKEKKKEQIALGSGPFQLAKRFHCHSHFSPDVS
jgi:hypothetical protein